MMKHEGYLRARNEFAWISRQGFEIELEKALILEASSFITDLALTQAVRKETATPKLAFENPSLELSGPNYYQPF